MPRGMKTTLLLASALLSACHVAIPGIASTSPAPGPAPAPQTNPDAPPSRPQGDLGAYYANLELDALYHLIHDERQSEIYERAKADVGRDRLWQSSNPDPTWILFWRTKDWTNATENAEAMTQAAFNRTWQASCVAEYAKAKQTHARLAERHRPNLERVDNLTNYYERMAAYASLAAEYEEDSAAAGYAIDKDPAGPVGFRVTILAHAVAYHQQSTHAWSPFPWAKFPTAQRVRGDRGGRELTSDDSFERAHYCGAVAQRGGTSTTPFTRFWSEGHMSAQRVAWPTVTGDERAVRARHAALVKEAQARFETQEPARVEWIDKNYGASGLAGFRDFKVVSVKGSTVKVTRTDKDSYQYACRTTNRIDRIENGRFIYQQRCKWGERSYRLDAEVTFDELPPGFAFAPGDSVHFVAEIQKDAKKQTKNTPAAQHHVRTLVLAGRQLDRVQRGKEPAMTW